MSTPRVPSPCLAPRLDVPSPLGTHSHPKRQRGIIMCLYGVTDYRVRVILAHRHRLTGRLWLLIRDWIGWLLWMRWDHIPGGEGETGIQLGFSQNYSVGMYGVRRCTPYVCSCGLWAVIWGFAEISLGQHSMRKGDMASSHPTWVPLRILPTLSWTCLNPVGCY
jgi:hypothetical protein